MKTRVIHGNDPGEKWATLCGLRATDGSIANGALVTIDPAAVTCEQCKPRVPQMEAALNFATDEPPVFVEEPQPPQMLFTAAVLARTVQVPLDIAEYPELLHAHLTAMADTLRSDIVEKGLTAVGHPLLRVSVEQYAEQAETGEG